MQEVYLAHHGILGQKWGVRRYQNKDGSLTAEGKKRYAIGEDGQIRKLSSSERRAIQARDAKRKASLEKARQIKIDKEKAKAAVEEHEKKKAEAISTGDADKIAKYFSEMSDTEIKVALARIDSKQSLQKAINNEAKIISEGKTKTDELMTKIGKATDYANTVVGFYNVAAKVNNAFNPGLKLSQIDGSWIGEVRKKERQAEKDLKEQKKKEKEDSEKQKVLNTYSADKILEYAKKSGNLTGADLGFAIKRMQNEEGLRKIAKGGEEAQKVLKTFNPSTEQPKNNQNNQNDQSNQNQQQGEGKKKKKK